MKQYSRCKKCNRPVGALGCVSCQRKKNQQEVRSLILGLLEKMDVNHGR